MITINAKVKERITKGLKKFQPILLKAHSLDINESDTVTIITDILCEIFGYDKYEHITSEFAIKRTYCDLAIKLNDKIPFLIECKAIALDLKENYIQQATNYASNSGIEWAVLTNGISWKVYHLSFGKAIEKELVYEFNLCELNPKKQNDIELLYYLCIEAFAPNSKATLDDLRAQKQIFNRFVIGQVILTDMGIDSIRKCIRKFFPDLKATNEEIYSLVYNEVLKREIIESEQADEAKKAVAKIERKLNNAKTQNSTNN